MPLLKTYIEKNHITLPLFGIIYKVTNCLDGKIYIGQTIQSIEQRKSKHYNKIKKGSYKSYFSNALNCYNKNDFLWEIIDHAFSKEELDEKEKENIWLYNSIDKNFGYNISLGGESHSKIDLNKAVELLKIKTPLIVISEKLKCDRSNLFNRLQAYLGKEKYKNLIEESRQNRRILKKEINKAILKELIDKGYFFREIAKKLNISRSLVQIKIKKYFGVEFYNKIAKENTIRKKEKIIKLNKEKALNKIGNISKIIDRWESGEAIKKIAKSLSIDSKNLKYFIAQEYGIDNYKKKAYLNARHKEG